MGKHLEDATAPVTNERKIVFSYGGGRQSVALILCMIEGRIPWPDHIIMADTGRENETTWKYHNQIIAPLLAQYSRHVEIAGPAYCSVGLHSTHGSLLIPVYSEPRGKYSTWCSSEWKRRTRDRYMKAMGIKPKEMWLGLGYEEDRRWKKTHMSYQGKCLVRCPMVDLQMTTAEGLALIAKHGLPLPTHSSCYMCPQKSNAEWIELKNNSPEQWAQAVALDAELREESIEDGKGPIYLHYNRKPLPIAIAEAEDNAIPRRCESEGCFT